MSYATQRRLKFENSASVFIARLLAFSLGAETIAIPELVSAENLIESVPMKIKFLCRMSLLVLPLTTITLFAQVKWVPRTGLDGSVPSHAIVADRRHGVTRYVCRARLAVGIHPGESNGSTCIVSYKGSTEEFEDFEFATASRYSWGRDHWDRAVIAGQQSGTPDIYVCRAHVARGSLDFGFIAGKAYELGPHAGHCYVPFQGTELDFVGDFELLYATSSTFP